MSVMRDPRAWLVQATALGRAADLVGSRFQGELQGWFLAEASRLLETGYEPTSDELERAVRATELALPAYMLVGYAIEVALKGLIVARDGTDEAIQWMTRQHLGPPLADRAKVRLQADERALVEKQLYHAVRWSLPGPPRT
jgi:hypothetical protein